jgi:hypothetical protein
MSKVGDWGDGVGRQAEIHSQQKKKKKKEKKKKTQG